MHRKESYGSFKLVLYWFLHRSILFQHMTVKEIIFGIIEVNGDFVPAMYRLRYISIAKRIITSIIIDR